jgi:molybdate transport system substrate-binding protein
LNRLPIREQKSIEILGDKMKMKREEKIMGKMRYGVVIVLLFALVGISTIMNCSRSIEEKKEVLIYCGITMIKPMSDIARIIEKQENCRIIITKGGSGNLLKSIKINKVGDLYLPGSDSYIKTCLQEDIVADTMFVGYNKAALMVQKGNPKGITADLTNLTSKEYSVVIGNPDSGSIGRETKKILEKRGIFQEVEVNVLKMTTDSKELVRVIKDREADIAINWYATSTWTENVSCVDVLGISEKYARKKKLVIGLLRTSKYPEIARKFMEYAASEQGQELFRKYGLYDVK